MCRGVVVEVVVIGQGGSVEGSHERLAGVFRLCLSVRFR